MGTRRERNVAGWVMALGLGLGGCIVQEADGGGYETDGPGKASASATPTSAGDDSSSSGPDTSASNTSPSTTDPSSGSTSGGDTDSTGGTMGIGDTGSTTDDSAGDTTTGDGSTGTTGAGAASFAMDIQPILNANCGCHQGGGTAGTLVLDAGVAYDNLVDVQSAQAAGVVRVAPTDPANSYMLAKLQGTHAGLGGSGNPMPPGGALNDTQITLIEDWIADGALP